MYRIIIELPEDRFCEGEIYLENAEKQRITSAYSVLGLSPSLIALLKGNRDRNPLRPYGNMPLGDYEVRAIYPTGEGTPFEEKQYGNRGIIVMVPVAGDCVIARRNGREKFFLVGSQPDRTKLNPTSEGVRISDLAMAALVETLVMLFPPVRVRCIERAQDVGGQTQIRTSTQPTVITESERYYDPVADLELETLWIWESLDGSSCDDSDNSNDSEFSLECETPSDTELENVLEAFEESVSSSESNADLLIEDPSLY